MASSASSSGSGTGDNPNGHCPGFQLGSRVLAKLSYYESHTEEFEKAPAYSGVVYGVIDKPEDVDSDDVKRMFHAYSRKGFKVRDMRKIALTLFENRGCPVLLVRWDHEGGKMSIIPHTSVVYRATYIKWIDGESAPRIRYDSETDPTQGWYIGSDKSDELASQIGVTGQAASVLLARATSNRGMEIRIGDGGGGGCVQSALACYPWVGGVPWVGGGFVTLEEMRDRLTENTRARVVVVRNDIDAFLASVDVPCVCSVVFSDGSGPHTVYRTKDGIFVDGVGGQVGANNITKCVGVAAIYVE